MVHDDVTDAGRARAPQRQRAPAATHGRKRRVEITGGLARSVLDSLEEGVVLFGAQRRDRRLQRLARCGSSGCASAT